MDHLEVLVARDADLHREERRPATAHLEDALDIDLVGISCDDGCRPPAAQQSGSGSGERIGREPHGQRDDRDRRSPGARVGHDVGGRGQVGAQDDGRVVERDHDLEVDRRLLAGAGLRRGWPDRAVADPGDPAGERLSGKGVDFHGGAVADRELRHVGLVHLHHHFDHPEVGDGEDQAARVVHGADDDRFSFLDLEPGDLAVHGRAEDGLGQPVVGLGDRSACLLHALKRGFQGSARDLDVGGGVLQLLRAHQHGVALAQAAQPLVVALGTQQAGFLLRCLGLGLAESRPRA